jgi:methionine sulfoxide reductase heme-binding subunit
MRALLHSRFAFCVLLALPALAMLPGFAAGDVIAMDMLAPTGEWSARLLILALAVTPLMGATGGAGWVRWLAARRRHIGVAAFLYALLHLGFYIVDIGVAAAVEELPLPGIWTGWLAFLAMLAMAATSNDAAVRALRATWKRLQRLAYPAALFTLVHWLIVHDGVTSALLHAAPLALLEAHRLFTARRKFRHA